MKYLVEDAVQLRLSHLQKKLLTRKDPGSFVLVIGLCPVRIDYEVLEIAGEKVVAIRYWKNDRLVSQWISLDQEDIRFGTRPYFRCNCGHKANTLYLRPGRDMFACRKCHDLVYELATLNKGAYHNQIFYLNNRWIKIREKMQARSLSYRGQKTKRALSIDRRLATFKRWQGVAMSR